MVIKGKGFTLIELLVVMMILMLLLGTAMTAFQTLSRTWARGDLMQQQEVNEYRYLDMMSSAVQGTVAYEVEKEAKDLFGFYFLGSETGFTGVTESGVYNAGRLSVYRVLKEQAQNGLYNLYYEEAPINNMLLVDAGQTLPFNFRMPVLLGLNSLAFEYFGWESLEKKQMSESMSGAMDGRTWHENYDGLDKQLQPDTVLLRIDGTLWPIDFSRRMDELSGRRMTDL